MYDISACFDCNTTWRVRSKGDKILVLEEKFLNAVAQHDSALAHSFAKRADLVEVELAMGSNATYSLLNRINTGYRYTKKVHVLTFHLCC